MKIGAEAFAKVGHYLQMVDNKATALSVAYDPSNAMSEAAFLHSPVTSAVSTNALAYQLRQGAGATTTRSDVKAKSDEVANLKLDKANQESQIIILQGKLEDARHTNSNGSRDGQCAKTIQNYKNSSCQQGSCSWKSKKRLLMYLGGRIEAAIQPKKQRFKKRKIC